MPPRRGSFATPAYPGRNFLECVIGSIPMRLGINQGVVQQSDRSHVGEPSSRGVRCVAPGDTMAGSRPGHRHGMVTILIFGLAALAGGEEANSNGMLMRAPLNDCPAGEYRCIRRRALRLPPCSWGS